jgi:polysaccharide transporter, PST family
MRPKRLSLRENLLLLKTNAGVQAILANITWSFAGHLLQMTSALFVGVWLARYLGAMQFGTWNYVGAIVALFNPISTMGLNAVVIRYLVKESVEEGKVLGTTFCLKFLGGLISILLSVSCAYLFRREDTLVIWLTFVISAGGLFESFDTIDLLFQSQVQSKYTVIAKNIAYISIIILQVILIIIKAPLLAFAWLKLAELGLSAAGLIIIYHFKGYSIKFWHWSFSLAKALLKESWPLILSGFYIMIYMKIDQIMLGKMLDEVAVGIYSAAARISEIWYIIPTIITASVAPSIYAAREIDESLYYSRIAKLNRLLVLISIACSLPLTVLSEPIITLLFGNGYVESAKILSIHTWASIFVSTGTATSLYFIAESLTRLSMYKALIGAVINVLLNLVLIPDYGALGAAIATVFSYAVSGFLIHSIFFKSQRIFKLQIKSILNFS